MSINILNLLLLKHYTFLKVKENIKGGSFKSMGIVLYHQLLSNLWIHVMFLHFNTIVLLT